LALVNEKITDKSISAHLPLLSVTRIRDTLNPLIQIRFGTNRMHAKWFILHRNSWKKVAVWPEVKTTDIRRNFSVLIEKVRNKQEITISADCLLTVGDVLTWHDERMQGHANLSEQRKKDIASGIKCHLMPCLESVDLETINKSLLDKMLIWPCQKKLAKSSVTKIFHTLKAAFSSAFDLDLMLSNPIAGIKISHFGDFSSDPKEPRLFPYMVTGLLDEMEEQTRIVKMLCMLILSLGTRIGETRKAKWHSFNLGNEPVWIIPKQDIKNRKTHTIHLPPELVELLKQWRDYQLKCRYKGKYLFPNVGGKYCLSNNEALAMVHSFSHGDWASHDLRKCARICWQEAGVDSQIAELMLNHSVGKVVAPYISNAHKLRLAALEQHCEWLKSQNNNCFVLSPDSVQCSSDVSQQSSCVAV